MRADLSARIGGEVVLIWSRFVNWLMQNWLLKISLNSWSVGLVSPGVKRAVQSTMRLGAWVRINCAGRWAVLRLPEPNGTVKAVCRFARCALKLITVKRPLLPHMVRGDKGLGV